MPDVYNHHVSPCAHDKTVNKNRRYSYLVSLTLPLSLTMLLLLLLPLPLPLSLYLSLISFSLSVSWPNCKCFGNEFRSSLALAWRHRSLAVALEEHDKEVDTSKWLVFSCALIFHWGISKRWQTGGKLKTCIFMIGICIEPRQASLTFCRFAGMQFGRKLITSRTVQCAR